VDHPKDVGDVSMLAVTLVLRALGYGLYLPYGENTRCDLIIERFGELARVQCSGTTAAKSTSSPSTAATRQAST